MTPAIEVIGLSKCYGEQAALDDVSLTVVDGEFLVLLGPSGCGKSTLLKLIAGLEDPTAGEILIRDELVNYTAPKDRDVAMVFQDYALYPHMSVQRNLAFPLRMRRQPKPRITERVAEVAATLGLDAMLAKLPEQLSGGQRQRVAVGRAMVRDPVAFLMDEPLSNLDALLRVQMRDELLLLQRRLERTMVYVTHDQIEAMTMADRIVVLRDGTIQQVGTPSEIYEAPANKFVATFVGAPQMNMFDGEVVAGAAPRFVAGDVAFAVGPAAPEGRVTLGIRPEDLTLVADGAGSFSGVVSLVEVAGHEKYVRVDLDGTGDLRVVVRAGRSVTVQEGERRGMAFVATQAHWFGDDGSRIESGLPTPSVI